MKQSDLRAIARHAATVLVGQWAVMGFSVADTIIAGQYSAQALAVMSLATSIYISIYVGLNGMLQSLLPVWAELRGAGQDRQIGPSVRQALYIAALAFGVGFPCLFWPGLWLQWTQVPPQLWPEVEGYLAILSIALAPSLLFRLYGTLNQALGHARLVTWLQAMGLAIKVPLSWALTFGAAGLPELGAQGCAWATLCVNLLMLACGAWWLWRLDVYKPYRLFDRLTSPDWTQLKRFLHLGIPAGLSIMVEVTSFTLMALFIARMGALASASHQIAATLAAVLYMVPLSLGIATSARTGYWLGAGQAARAHKSVLTGLQMGLVLSLVCAAALWLTRAPISRLFSSQTEVQALAAVWLAWVALYHVSDTLQAISAFVLRCYRQTIMPLVVYTVLLWGVGVGFAYRWAYEGIGPLAARPRVDTFWISSTLALAMVSALLVLLLMRVSDQRTRAAGR
jgi:multidrug resistance protein, MATE family